MKNFNEYNQETIDKILKDSSVISITRGTETSESVKIKKSNNTMKLLNQVKTELEKKGYKFEDISDEHLRIIYDTVYTTEMVVNTNINGKKDS